MMKRKLIMQMRNEWRSNLWMMVELFVVGLVLWMVFTVFTVFGNMHQEPKGLDLNDIYVGSFCWVTESSEKFMPYDENHSYYTDRDMLIAQLQSNPYVEIVGTGNNALPYNLNYYGSSLSADINGDTETYVGNWRSMSPDAIKAIRLHGLNGETPDQLAEIVKRGDIILGTTELSESDTDPLQWRGKQAWSSYDSTKVYNIAAVVNGIRRTDYEPTRGTIISAGDWNGELIVRVKEGQGRQFLSSLSDRDLEFGNVYVSGMQSLDDIKDDVHRDIDVMYRNMIVCAVFVLVSVFLGFLGSFWYRTQQRVPELALRKVNGATNADLMRRFISEGLLLLVIPAMLLVPTGLLILRLLNAADGMESFGAVTFTFAVYGLPMGMWTIWAGLGMSIASLAIMIVAGIWMPARKAMKVDPGIALKDQ